METMGAIIINEASTFTIMPACPTADIYGEMYYSIQCLTDGTTLIPAPGPYPLTRTRSDSMLVRTPIVGLYNKPNNGGTVQIPLLLSFGLTTGPTDGNLTIVPGSIYFSTNINTPTISGLELGGALVIEGASYNLNYAILVGGTKGPDMNIQGSFGRGRL